MILDSVSWAHWYELTNDHNKQHCQALIIHRQIHHTTQSETEGSGCTTAGVREAQCAIELLIKVNKSQPSRYVLQKCN